MKSIRWAALLATVLFALCASMASAQTGSIPLTWTSPGDDGMVGTCVKMDLRFWRFMPDTSSLAAKETSWAAATPVTGLPLPLPGGTVQNVVVPGLGPGEYIFGVRYKDDEGLWGAFGNTVRKTVTSPPAAVLDIH